MKIKETEISNLQLKGKLKQTDLEEVLRNYRELENNLSLSQKANKKLIMQINTLYQLKSEESDLNKLSNFSFSFGQKKNRNPSVLSHREQEKSNKELQNLIAEKVSNNDLNKQKEKTLKKFQNYIQSKINLGKEKSKSLNKTSEYFLNTFKNILNPPPSFSKIKEKIVGDEKIKSIHRFEK